LTGIACLTAASILSAADLRIVTYNVDADTGGGVGQMGGPDGGPGLIPVLEAIGAIHLGDGVAQPIDVLALQEMNAPSTTAAWIVGQLNSYYGAGAYAYDPNVDPTTDGTGGGPSGLIYNTKTVQDLGATFLAYGTSGAPRAPARYTLQPVGGTTPFYLYVSHMLSSGGNRQTVEATEIRNDAATLGASANIIYSGELNSQLNENGYPGYNGLVVTATPSPGQGIDPGSTILKTYSATSLRYVDDHQLVTAPVYNGTNNFQIVSSSYTVFGNNGSTGNSGSVNQPSNTAMNDLGSNAMTVLGALTTATDHLPVVADYSVNIGPPPAIIALSGAVSGRIMAGGSATLGATVANSAASGANNLNFSLAAAVTGGAATLGSVSPNSGTLAPGAGQPCTVSATSTNLGPNTTTFTANDPNASNSPQMINATLTVVDNRVVTATPVDFGVVHVGQAASGTATLSTAGDNNYYTAVTVPGGSDGHVTVAGTSTVFNSDGQSEVRAVTANAFQTPGSISNTISLATQGEGLVGESPIPVPVTYYASVFSGSGRWLGNGGGTSWGTNDNWQDTQVSAVRGAPGTFVGYSDAALLDDLAIGGRTITLDGTSPQLSSLTFNTPSGNGYTVAQGTGGTLQFNNGPATATLSVTAGTHGISAPMAFSTSGAISLAAATQLTVSGNVSGSPSVANSGALNIIGGSQTLGLVTGSGALNVGGGATTTAASIGSAAAGNVGSLDVSGAGTQLSTQSVFQNSIEIDAGARLSITAARTAGKSTASSLMIAGTTNAWTGDFDVGASGIVLAGQTAADATMIGNMIKQGRAGGTWAGTTGITSTAAAAYPSQTAIGYTYNSTTENLVIAAAIPGDLNLDGRVNSIDLAIFQADFGKSDPAGVSTWQFGDLNYDGRVNAIDLAILQANFGKSGFPSYVEAGRSGLAPVPEPGTLALLAAALAAACVAAVRRRANR